MEVKKLELSLSVRSTMKVHRFNNYRPKGALEPKQQFYCEKQLTIAYLRKHYQCCKRLVTASSWHFSCDDFYTRLNDVHEVNALWGGRLCPSANMFRLRN